MKRQIDPEALFTAIPGDSPSGEDLRYSQVYEDIKEARRYDDPLDQGEWKTELKKADWDRVITVAVDGLTNKSKDLQIAVWLAEALIIKEGFEGCSVGLQVVNGLLENFWESLFPEIEDDDLEYRVAPLELMNEKVSASLRQAPVTDPLRTLGYSWARWQESRQVGYDAESRDEGARKKREEAMGEGKLTADEFDAAVTVTSPGFYKTLSETLASCTDEFKRLDELVDEKFGQEAPRLSEFGKALEDVNQLVQKICKDKGLFVSSASEALQDQPAALDEPALKTEDSTERTAQSVQTTQAVVIKVPAGNQRVLIDIGSFEQALWDDAVNSMRTTGVATGLDKLMEATLAAPSVRGQSRFKLLLAKLCLQAGRADLGRPILEQLYAMIDELHLEKWESPVWIAEVFGALYQCLMTGETSDADLARAEDLFQRLCTIDITKAIEYRK